MIEFDLFRFYKGNFDANQLNAHSAVGEGFKADVRQCRF